MRALSDGQGEALSIAKRSAGRDWAVEMLKLIAERGRSTRDHILVNAADEARRKIEPADHHWKD